MTILTLPQSDTLTVRAKALVFEDDSSRQLLERIQRVAPTQATVLITGETGTGKEIIARHIHALSTRSSRPFVAVNCGAFSSSLVEAELFGHEKGAYTGAVTAKQGWFEAAHGGTLFLDEIGDLPLAIQVKLLRVLQEGEVVRIGSRHPVPIDVRFIAATNVNLEQAMAAGHFREDLFYRLNVSALRLPPLRERRGDILPLAEYFIRVYAERLSCPRASLHPSAQRILLDHSWPGNIRELENVIHHGLLVCQNATITAADLSITVASSASGPVSRPVLRQVDSTPPPSLASGLALNDPEALLERAFVGLLEQGKPDLHEYVDRTLMATAYKYCEKNQLQTARSLGISRNIVRARLIQYGELAGTPRASLRDSTPPPSFASSPAQALSGARETVRIGYQVFGLLPAIRARGGLEQSLARRSVALEWLPFPSGVELVEAFASGSIDLGVVGDGPAVLAQALGKPLTYVAAEALSPDSEAILVPAGSSIGSVGQLRGKTVAVNRGSNAHYLLLGALDQAGIAHQDVRLAYLPPEQARGAFASGSVDAWAIWDPWLSAARADLGARVLRDRTGLAKSAAYYLATRSFAHRYPHVIDAFVRQLHETAAWVRDDVERAAHQVSQAVGFPQAALVEALARSSGPRPLDAQLVSAQQQVANTFHRVRLLNDPVAIRPEP